MDLIVTYVDSTKKSWQKEFEKYRQLEITSGNTELGDSDFNGESRYRDLGTFKYFFRSVEKNCPWIDKVFLVVADRYQVPSWIDKNNPKLRIVYHKDYIPEELLPTFNSNIIEMFFYKIEELSNNYILCNDDTFFIHTVTPFDFFASPDKIITSGTALSIDRYADGDSLYRDTLNNNIDFEKRYFKECNRVPVVFSHPHVPSPHLKEIERLVWEADYDELYNGLSISRFRNSHNFTHFLFYDICIITGFSIPVMASYYKAKCVNLRKLPDFNKLSKYSMVCLNDSGITNNFDYLQNKVINFLDKLFPEKSSYEK